MGGSVSTGKNNDDLIDNLLAEGYISTPIVEKVFRAVDRGFYCLPEFKNSAYRDMAWKQGNLHLSAPCIYTKVLEDLKLENGQSFLNIGSGTGYFSTMVGLILGPYGVNHGIEIQADVVSYALEKLDEFKRNSNAVDVSEFCEPEFVVGNGLELSSGQTYDRIYCGASCPREHHPYIKNYLKIGGILIVPCDEDLLKFTRISERQWDQEVILSVSFSTMQSLKRKTVDLFSMPSFQPLCLQELCRSRIRSILRNVVENENRELKEPRKTKSRTVRGTMRNPIIISCFDQNSGPALFHDFFMRGIAHIDTRNDVEESENSVHQLDLIGDTDSDSLSSSSSLETDFRKCTQNNTSDLRSRIETDFHKCTQSNIFDPKSGIEEDTTSSTCHKLATSNSRPIIEDGEKQNYEEKMSDKLSSFVETDMIGTDKKKLLLNEYKRAYSEVKTDEDHPESNRQLSLIRKQVVEERKEANCNQPKKLLKREKLDSGISEESDDGKISVTNESSCSESLFSEPMELESDGSSNSCIDNEFNESNPESSINYDIIMLNYRKNIEKKLKSLLLPHKLKIFLNYDREFDKET